jgi:hypothetical protein
MLMNMFQINFLFFINGDGMHFDIVYHNLDNYNVCAKSIEHDG